MTPQQIADVFALLELELIRSLKQALLAGKKERAGWKLRRMQDVQAYRRRNQQIVADHLPQLEEQTAALLQEAYRAGVLDTAEQHREQADPTYILEGDFDGVDDRRLDALVQEVNENFRTVEMAALRRVEDIYKKIAYQAQIAQATGAVTMEQAVNQVAKQFLERGIDCVQYADGRRVNIASYAEMALRTAATRSKCRGDAALRRQLGVDTVLVSQYGACSETCLPWQGRVYIDDVWGDPVEMGADGLAESRNGHRYMLLSVAVAEGLFHPNCRHSLSTWYEGISKPPPVLDAAAIRRTAALESRQRELERKVRKYKRLEAGALDPDNEQKYRQKRLAAQKQLREFIAANDDVLRRNYWREKTYGMQQQPKRRKSTITVPDNHKAAASPAAPFDIDAARQEYKNFLQSVPEKNRMYLEYFSETAEFRRNTDMKSAYAYSLRDDVVYYNDTRPAFRRYKFDKAITHELAHRADCLLIHAEESDEFRKAIQEGAKSIATLPIKEVFKEILDDEDTMALQDVFSALYGGYHPDLSCGHSKKYYSKSHTKEREIFANMFTLETSNRRDLIEIIQKHFPSLYAAYLKLFEEVII